MIDVNDGLHAAEVETVEDVEAGRFIKLSMHGDDGESHYYVMQPHDAYRVGLELLAHYNRTLGT